MMDLEHLNQSRMLALKLSTLAPEDYQWFQTQVPAEAWQVLASLVDEIRQLGMGLQYPELLQLLALNSKNDAARQKSRLELMNDVQWEDLLRLFKSEAEPLFPLFSSLHDWRWKNNPRFIEYRKRRSHQFNDNWGNRPLLKEALLEIVGDALLSDTPTMPKTEKSRRARTSAALKAVFRRVTANFRRGQSH